MSGVAAAALVAGLSAGFSASAQTSQSAKAMVTQHVSESDLITLGGNTRSETVTGTDLGRVSDDLAFPHLSIQLQRSPAQQAALDTFLANVNNPKSTDFHKWVNAAEFGSRFGLAPADITAVTSWLGSHGIAVNSVSANLVMDVSATAGQLTDAFHTEIHKLNVNGVQHFANMSDPRIPAALAGVVAGPASMHDFMPHMLSKPRPNFTTPLPGATGTFQVVVPLDLQTIYNISPLYASGISGQGMTIAVVEDSDLFSNADWSTFRKELGLSRAFPQGNLSVIHPNASTGPACVDPGDNGDDGEAALDVEWSSAAAPNASIMMIACKDTTEFGGFIGLQNVLNGAATLPQVVSISFGESESEEGAAGNLLITNLYALAAAQGVSVFVSSGDEGAASSDADRATATHGIAVSGFTSTPNNVSVGGTDFADTFLGTVNNYWSATNGTFANSALSYVPEIPWNGSCASQLLAIFNGFANTTGVNGFCNSTAATMDSVGLTNITTASGSGGPSGCATGAPTTRGVVGGNCAGYAKPSWQQVFGNPNDGVRDIPDVSLFASNGFWNHFYLACYSNPAGGGTPCSNQLNTWAGFGGTSISSPIMAAIQALVDQKTGTTWGNPNPIYYSLANSEYGTSGNAACNSEAAGGPAKSCVFYDITLGDMDVDCTPLVNKNAGTSVLNNCFNNGGTEGALSTSNNVLTPAFASNVGWDFPTGIGSVNAFNLVTSPAWMVNAPS
jgi:subtilase family serine protease